MTDPKNTPRTQWTIKRAAVLGIVSLIVGIAGGWSIRGSQHPPVSESAKANIVPAVTGNSSNLIPQANDAARMREMADEQSAPLLEKVKSDPNNTALLISIGNVYYDAQQYPVAIEYYGRALKSKPSDVAVRTDMATAFWYTGNADGAIAEFDRALKYEPNNPNTLFNRGLVRWKGKKDGAGAVADWKKLLAANPKYGGRDKVEQMLAEVTSQTTVSSAAKAD